MHTKASVTLGEHRAILSLAGKTLEARVLEPADARLSVEDVTLAPPQNTLVGVRRVQILLGSRAAARIAVLLAAPGASSPAVSPLGAWATGGPGR